MNARREPAALLPPAAARLIGFVALGSLGVAEWTRMVAGLGLGRALGWVALAAATGAAIRACEQLPGLWRPALSRAGVLLAGVALSFPAAGIEWALLRPKRWDELGEGLWRGGDALATVRLPYEGADPWPALALGLLGALLCVGAAALTMWPRRGPGAARGYPFFALAVLLTLAATPVVSLGGTRPIFVGGGLAALTVCFLWLEKLALRPGFGVAALLGVALAGALPLAGAADRETAWFDYKAFAEGLGPGNPARFNWSHSYGPITWPRDRREVLRIKTKEPEYWKAQTLDDFSGGIWSPSAVADLSDVTDRPPDTELPEVQRPEWTRTFDVAVRQLRTRDVVGAGTTLGIDDPSRAVEPTSTGGYSALSDLRRGDSYSVRAYVPEPSPAELAASSAGAGGAQTDDLNILVPYTPAPGGRGGGDELSDRGANALPRGGLVSFPSFDFGGEPTAVYEDLGEQVSGDLALRNSPYARTWLLAQRLRAQARTPYAYLRAVDRFLHRDEFTYSERPEQPAQGVAPLDGFLFDTQDGYCQHYSGAMALLLRMGGVPARVASGFSPGGFSKRRGEWVVRDSDAHSWVEAWFDDYGWVTFDPTPGETPARSQTAVLPEEDADEGAAGGDETSVPGLDEGGPRQIGGGALPSGSDAAAEDAGAGGGPAWWLWAGVAVCVALLALLAARWLGWFARLGTGRGAGRGATPLDRAVLELEAAFRRAGRPTPPGTTLHQLEARLSGSADAVAYVRALRSGRYAASAPRPTTVQRRAVRRELAYGLGWTGRLRAWWALPPRRG